MLCLPSWTRRLWVNFPLVQIYARRISFGIQLELKGWNRHFLPIARLPRNRDPCRPFCSIGNLTWWISWGRECCESRMPSKVGSAFPYTLVMHNRQKMQKNISWSCCKKTTLWNLWLWELLVLFWMHCFFFALMRTALQVWSSSFWHVHCGRRLRRWHLSLRPIGTWCRGCLMNN